MSEKVTTGEMKTLINSMEECYLTIYRTHTETSQRIIDVLRGFLSRSPLVDKLVEAVEEDIKARFPYLTLTIATIGEWERRKTKAMNAVETALAAYEAALEAGKPGNDEDMDVECGSCGEEFRAHRDIEVTYSSEKKERKP
jgi:hypothetical protein